MATRSYVSGRPTVVELGNRVMKAANEVSFADTNASSGDVCQVLTIPQYAKVNRVDCIIKTAEGSAVTGEMGDGADTNGWDASINFNAAAGTLTSPTQGTDAYAYGKFYTSEDTIDIIPGAGGLSTAVVVVSAEYTMSERYA
jgi:hypothetical protein